MSDTGLRAPSQDGENLVEGHDYDGIREYDNPLPGWWVWLFWASILFCFPYAVYYHLGEGKSLEQAYEDELAEQADRLLATYGKLEPDADTMVRFAGDPTAMAGMASVFRARCAQCHRADGSGAVGPNLTDAAWLHVRRPEDVFRVLDEGVPLRGMPAWGKALDRTQLVLLSAYVASLQRRALPGKEAQGEPQPPLLPSP